MIIEIYDYNPKLNVSSNRISNENLLRKGTACCFAEFICQQNPYLGAWIQPNGTEKETSKRRARKIEQENDLFTMQISNIRSRLLSQKSSIDRAECTVLNKKGEM